MAAVRRFPVLTFYLVAFLFAGVWEVLDLRYGANSPILSVLTLLLASYGPTLGTLVVLALLHDAEENRAWRRRLLTFRVSWRWYALALLLPAAVWLAGTALSTLFGGQFPFHPILWAVFPFLLIPNAGEEMGWRGFALPHVLTRHNALVASLILGAMWAVFHLPLYSQSLIAFLPFAALMVAFSILMTWAFNATGSVPFMVLMHASMDATQFVSPVNETGAPTVTFALIALVMWLVAIVIILRTGTDLGRKGAPALSKPAIMVFE